jgi:hypothetical protein
MAVASFHQLQQFELQVCPRPVYQTVTCARL